jgi:drug/metabolite transporter (DMT)-like permease
MRVGSVGFELGIVLLLVGQQMSDPVTPAIAAAMMPIAGAVLEVLLDGRKMRWYLVVGIVLALVGGFLATGVRLSEGRFGLGVALCLSAVVLFAWTTRSTTRSFPGLSALGQTTITLIGGMVLILLFYVTALAAGMPTAEIGLLDTQNITLLLVSSVASLAFAQLLWIWGAGGLGILLASFHMNAVPFYVMVIVVLMLDGQWNWIQAVGAALVATGVIISQSVSR